jgi:hypothetical protein
MKRTVLTSALTLVLAVTGTAAFADGATYDYPTSFTSTLTTAAVRADAVDAARKGETLVGEAQNQYLPASFSGLTRTQVAAEAHEARRLGLLAVGERTIVATAEEQRAVRLAGERALAQRFAANTR